MITAAELDTPLGTMLAGATDAGICLLDFGDRAELQQQTQKLCNKLKAELVSGEHALLTQLQQQLREYFDGQRTHFDLPLVIEGTEFQQKAWCALQEIPFGETRSYQQQAIAVGNPSAVRAVASANANNHIAIIIPCHRVIAKNGNLAGYGGGVWRKQFLLDLEKRH